jgi:hypothetical protein
MAANLLPISSDGGFTSGGNINLNGNLNLPLGSIVYETNIPDGALSGSAIALKPAGGTTANQQLLIYPTAADGDHVHLTSGNLYATELFLGSDNLYVKLANTGNVVINSNDGNSSNAMWTFGTDGSLTFPIGISIDNSVDPLYPKIIADSNLLFSVQGQGANGSAALAWTIDPNAASQYAAVAVTRAGGDDLAKVILTAQANSGDSANAKVWTFNEAGNLTLPGNTFAVNYANGTQVSISGGNANTGNVTFSDQIVIGTGSNDGTGGLYLAPGNNSIANSALQYLRVRGGDVVTHIHLDTGNNQFYDQYFGDDAKYVKLELGDTGNVVIGTDDANGNQYNWSFTSDGNLILAGGNSVIQSIANSSSEPLYPNTSTMVFTPDALLSSQSLVLDPTGPSHIHLRAPGANIDEPDANIFLGGEASSFEVGYYNGAAPNLFIHSNNNTWTFDTTGILVFPRDTDPNVADPILTIVGGANPSISAIDASLAGPANLGISALTTIFSGFTGDEIKIYPDDGEISSTANLQIWANSGGNTEYSWTFDTTGNLTTPSNLVIGPGTGSGSRIFQYDEGLEILGEGANSVVQLGWTANTSAPDSVTTIAMNYPGGGEGNVLIAVGNNATTVNYWLFDNTGNLRLPGNTFAVNYANGTQVSLGGGNVTWAQIEDKDGNSGPTIITLGQNAGLDGQGNAAIAIGKNAGQGGQGDSSITIGEDAGGNTTQGANAVAIGKSAGFDAQGEYAVAIGHNAGYAFQGLQTVAVGLNAGSNTQSNLAVAIGTSAGSNTQGDAAVAIGATAGFDAQGNQAVAIGTSAGENSQGAYAVAIGSSAGSNTQGGSAVALGTSAGENSQGVYSVAIGYAAAQINQGTSAVAVGLYAGQTNQANNSIVLNATGAALNQTVANTFTVAPVRNDVSNIAEVMFYNATSKEVTYGNTISVAGNANVGNLNTTTAIITTGNITTINSGLLQNGNSNITITSNGNVSIQAAGSNVELVVTSTGANITGTLDATGNITGANLVAGSSGLGNVYAGNVIINGQPTTYGVANLTTGVVAIQATATGTVTATVVANTSPDLSSFSNGTSTSPATTVFTLSIPSAGTWQLESWIRTFSTTGTPLISGGFYTGGTLVANSETLLWPSPVTNANGAGYMSAVVTTTGAATYTVGLWTTGTGVGLFSDSAGRTKAQATQISSIFALNTLDTMSATGNISANNFIGNGGSLSNVATKVAGSWTLASGNNTVNISVPLNGTYSIWVNGNIPNGIITYTATAVVTNTNVPVLGSQYAWYYSVGNALVLTSIPDQFTGTVGSISNVNTYVGNTANVFTFGITNNSGANAVVNYGYTKL